MKLIIAGTRTFENYKLFKQEIENVINEHKITDIEIISGCARGADSLAIKYAVEKGFKLHKFPAQWEKYGKSAGYLRNEEMAKFGKDGMLIVFWDGCSKGTKHMLDIGTKYSIPTYIIYY